MLRGNNENCDGCIHPSLNTRCFPLLHYIMIASYISELLHLFLLHPNMQDPAMHMWFAMNICMPGTVPNVSLYCAGWRNVVIIELPTLFFLCRSMHITHSAACMHNPKRTRRLAVRRCEREHGFQTTPSLYCFFIATWKLLSRASVYVVSSCATLLSVAVYLFLGYVLVYTEVIKY